MTAEGTRLRILDRMLAVVGLVAALVVVGCSGDVPRCVPGSSSACTCATGRAGAQVCSPAGAFGSCVCLSGDDGGSGADVLGQPDAAGPDAAAADATREDGATELADAAIDAAVDATDANIVEDRADAGRPPPPDASGLDAMAVGGDVALLDSTMPTDLPAPSDAVADARGDGGIAFVPEDPCSSNAIVDAAREGTTFGATTVVRRDSAFSIASSALRPPAACAGATGHAVVVRHLMRTTARLYVSTDSAGTDSTFDTVVWALDRCSADARVLGCNDGVPAPSGTSPVLRLASGTYLRGSLAAGTEVFIVVAGARAAAGVFELALTEVPGTRADGELCTRGPSDGACAAGSSCVNPFGDGYFVPQRRCVRDGSLFGACRTDGAPCDSGLACDGNPWLDASRCRPRLADGARCVEPRNANDALSACEGICAQTADGGRCVADGALYGTCRLTAPACEPGLVCSGEARTRRGRCVRPQPAGGTCALNNPLSACPSGQACVPATPDQNSMLGICRDIGGSGGRCRTDAPACEGGLACADALAIPLCRPVVAVGATCDATGATSACAPGAACLVTPTGARCVPDGSDGGRCRSTAPTCDAALRCNGALTGASARCVPTAPPGAACDPAGRGSLCAEGASCIAITGGGRCVVDGTEGGRCRASGASRCDSGLSCNSQRLCRRTLTLGARCTTTAEADACPDGSSCLALDGGTFCVVDGALNGLCRSTGPTCDAGLLCFDSDGLGSPRRCRTPPGAGAPCIANNFCGLDAACFTNDGTRVCRPIGSADSYCRPPFAGLTRCDAGLMCNGSTCVRAAALDGTCSYSPPVGCVAGSSCDILSTGMVTGRCVADGAQFGICRAEGPACDAGLACGRSGRCVPVAASGATCDDYEQRAVCASGLRCLAGRCATEGVLGGPCRLSATALTCNAGSVCDRFRCVAPQSLGTWCMNRGSFPCDLNAQCGGGGTAENNCTTVRYSWAAMSGATILDACDGGVVLPTGSGATTYASAVPTPIPFPFALFGRAVDAVRPSVAPFAVLMSMGQPNGFFPESAGAESGQPGLGFGVGSRSDAMCIRTFGTAPNRRFVVEWLGVHASEETRRTVVEAVLEEGTNAIEMRYGPTDRVLEPSAFTYDYAGPWISGGPNEWVLPPRLIVTPPMTVRFTPR